VAEPPLLYALFEIDELLGELVKIPVRVRFSIDLFPCASTSSDAV
jgi:hypothetical protein